MRRVIPMLLLVAGLGLASAWGSRPTPDVLASRHAAWASARAGDAAPPVVVPAPAERLSDWWAVAGPGWLAGVALIVLGAGLARREQRAAFAGTGSHVARLDLLVTLDRLEEVLAPIRSALADLPMDDTAPALRDALDALQVDWIDPVVERRGQLLARHGLTGFVEYFGAFSAVERQLRRVWTALADGHAQVAREALEDALGSLADTRAGWVQVEQPSPPSRAAQVSG